jgi:hypothetical protein
MISWEFERVAYICSAPVMVNLPPKMAMSISICFLPGP